VASERCGYCGAALDPPEGRGRPATYCGTACRRLAENVLRRLSRQLHDLDDQLGMLERRRRGLGYGGTPEGIEKEFVAVSAIRADVEAQYERRVRQFEGAQ